MNHNCGHDTIGSNYYRWVMRRIGYKLLVVSAALMRCLASLARFLLKGVVGSVILIGLLCGISVYSDYAFDSLSPISANLPRGSHEADAEFNKRLREKFPPGSYELLLINDLVRQGFGLTTNQFPSHVLRDTRVPGKWSENLHSGGLLRQTPLVNFDIICSGRSRAVFWQSDGYGKIVEVAGSTGSSNCL